MAKSQTLTLRKLEAMSNALTFALAGPIDGSATPQKDFEDAADWVAEKIAKRNSKKPRRHT